jgi:hypothetical protein
VSQLATPTGHVILFEHDEFRGKHKHLFYAERNLGEVFSPNEEHFDNITSSIVVLEGTWEFFSDRDFVNLQGILPRGSYYSLRLQLNWPNDTISSARPSCGPVIQ